MPLEDRHSVRSGMFIGVGVRQTLTPFGGAEPTLDTSFNLIFRSPERRKRMMSLVSINMAHLRCEEGGAPESPRPVV